MSNRPFQAWPWTIGIFTTTMFFGGAALLLNIPRYSLLGRASEFILRPMFQFFAWFGPIVLQGFGLEKSNSIWVFTLFGLGLTLNSLLYSIAGLPIDLYRKRRLC